MIEITTLDDPRVLPFSRLTEAQLRMELEPDKGLFIAESPKVIRVALNAGWQPMALLCERKMAPMLVVSVTALMTTTRRASRRTSSRLGDGRRCIAHSTPRVSV